MGAKTEPKESKLIILSRDGVINEYRSVIADPDDWVPIEGSLDALAQLHRADFVWSWPPISPASCKGC